jgi:hypothetical protein
MTAVGTEHDAWMALIIDHGGYCKCGCGNDAAPIGRGEARTVYLINGVVYKVARRPSANVYEHDMLTEWRAAGVSWAPATSLWRFSLYDTEEIVLAMPYLPDDGGDLDAVTLSAIRRAAPQTCRENYVSHGGQTYLIDGGDIELSPTA